MRYYFVHYKDTKNDSVILDKQVFTSRKEACLHAYSEINKQISIKGKPEKYEDKGNTVEMAYACDAHRFEIYNPLMYAIQSILYDYPYEVILGVLSVVYFSIWGLIAPEITMATIKALALMFLCIFLCTL